MKFLDAIEEMKNSKICTNDFVPEEAPEYRRNNYKEGTKEKCCKHCVHKQTYEYHDKYYHKCLLQGVSRAENSDIRLKNVCDNFEITGG